MALLYRILGGHVSKIDNSILIYLQLFIFVKILLIHSQDKMTIEDDMESFREWATKLGCPPDAMPNEDALKS